MINEETTRNDPIQINNLWKVFGSNPSIVLQPENLGKSRSDLQSEFGQVVALRDISFTVQRGETFVIIRAIT